MARRSHPIPSVALILWVLLTHFCSGVRLELRATVGESVTFVCTVKLINVSSARSVSWQWSKDGVVLTQSDSRIVGVGTANLTILSVEESDFGNYSCSQNPVRAANQTRQDFILSEISPDTPIAGVDTNTNIYHLSGVIGGCGLLLLLLVILFVAVCCCHIYCTQENALLLKVHPEEQIKKSLSAKSGSRDDDYEYVSIAGGDKTIEQSVPPGQPGLPVQQVLSRPPDQPEPPVPSCSPVQLLPSGPLAPVPEENAYESIDYDSSSEEMKTAQRD